MLYIFNTNKSNNLIKKYNLSHRSFFVDEKQREKGMELLLKYTIRKLNKIRLENIDLLLSLESLRFLDSIIWFQHHPNHFYYNYYKTILHWFHHWGHLLFKQQIEIHIFKTKRHPIAYLLIPINKQIKQYPYISGEQLYGDFGRYRGDMLLRNRNANNQVLIKGLEFLND